jgi:hypothetical protein
MLSLRRHDPSPIEPIVRLVSCEELQGSTCRDGGLLFASGCPHLYQSGGRG